MEDLAGVEFAERPAADPSKRPIREIVGIPLQLITALSRRDAAITTRLGQLAAEFQRQRGREPTPRGGSSAKAKHRVLRTRSGNPITGRRYDNLHGRFRRYLPWADAKGVTVHWLRHTTLTFVEREFGEAVARRYAAHRDSGTTATPIYTKASLVECARALVAVTGQPHPLARIERTSTALLAHEEKGHEKGVW